MRRRNGKIVAAVLVAAMTFSMAACGASETGNGQAVTTAGNGTSGTVTGSSAVSGSAGISDEAAAKSDVTIQFGDSGKVYVIDMEDNATAMELARNVSSAGRNLPIYNFNNYEGWEDFQYYDIPSRYTIPSSPVNVTSVKAGEVYYSSPNRVMLFYQDAEISGEYTKVGTIRDTAGLKEAVENNPVLEGWGNKLVLLRYAK